jgi:murein DD-endopeptidase MepM/ murein hydrolase activator NlpD
MWMVLLLSGAAAAAAPPSVDGTWRGVLAGKLHLALTIMRAGDQYSGILDSIDQNATLPIDHMTVAGGTVRFEITRVGGSFEGTLDSTGNQLTGTWTQGGGKQPLSFLRDTKETAHTNDTRPAQKPLDAPIDLQLPQPPAPLHAGARTHLVYELHLTNLSRRELSLRRIVVLDGAGAPLARLEAADLAVALFRPGAADAVGLERLRIGPGLRAVAYLWITLDAAAPPPAALEHRVTVQLAGDSDELTVTDARVAPFADRPLVLGAPLRGRGWRAANGPSNTSSHRRALIPVGGRARLAQRFAIDWIQLGDDGKTFTGDRLKNESYHAYGAEALAAADGVVVTLKDGIPQNVPGGRAVPMTLETLCGNHVILDLGGGRFAFYAHLQPGSLRVKLGERVKRGQILGLVGNSGNSSEPHLHFHVTDGNSPLAAEGVPYVLDAFDAGQAKRARQLPLEDEVVAF